MRRLVWILLIAAACHRTRAKPSKVADARTADSAVAVTSVDAQPSPEAQVVARARAMCSALAAHDPSAQDFVRLPLRWHARVGGDACSSGAVPCRYVTRTIQRTDQLTCAGWEGLDGDAADLERHTTINGTHATIETELGQFALYLDFEQTAAGYVLVGISDDTPSPTTSTTR